MSGGNINKTVTISIISLFLIYLQPLISSFAEIDTQYLFGILWVCKCICYNTVNVSFRREKNNSCPIWMAAIHALASKGTAQKPHFRMKASDPLQITTDLVLGISCGLFIMNYQPLPIDKICFSYKTLPSKRNQNIFFLGHSIGLAKKFVWVFFHNILWKNLNELFGQISNFSPHHFLLPVTQQEEIRGDFRKLKKK